VPRLTRIYTRKGDDGTTRLGGGQKVPKHAPRIEAYGTVDELSSALGLALASGLDPLLETALRRIQNELFHLGTDLCFLPADRERLELPGIAARHVAALEQLLDELTAAVGPLENFILPGGSEGAARLHVARTVCRRAERILTALHAAEPVAGETLRYLNRLSDALFVMARFENKQRGVSDILWDSHA
jgi:cob(I)alamin adenosyltransferase